MGQALVMSARAMIEKEPELLPRSPPACCWTSCAARPWASWAWPAVSTPRRTWRERYARLLHRLHQAGGGPGAAGPPPAAIRPGAPGRRPQARARPAVHLPGPADPVRPLLHPQRGRRALRAAPGLLHARGHGPGHQRDRPRGAAPSSSTSCCPSFDFMSSTPTLFNSGTLRPAAQLLLPDHGAGRPGRHLRRHQGQRPAVQVRRRPGQRLDPGARHGRPHQGHQRQEPGRGALPQGGQRHRGGGQPGRQAQGRGLRLPGDLAHRHRGVPGAAQEHRRRPPPHPRHEHRQLDSGPVHEAGGRGRRLDPVLPGRDARTCTTSRARPSRSAYTAYEEKAARGEMRVSKTIKAVDLWRKMLGMLFETGHPWMAFKDPCNLRYTNSTTWARSTAPTSAPRSPCTPTTRRSPCATWAR